MTDSAQYSQRSSHVGKAIAQATARAFKLPPSEVVDLFDEIKDALLQECHDQIESLETERRIAEAKVSILANKGSTEAFNEAWNDIESLGYSDVEREASMVFYRAQFLLRHVLDEMLVSETLDRLASLADKQTSRHTSEHFASVHARLLKELAARRGKK